MAALHNVETQATQTIQHFSHPKHPLQHVYIATDYKCDGCHAAGSGARYQCQICKFDLHERCATYPLSLMSHLHLKHPLTLMKRSGNARSCDSCGKGITGMFYTCKACNFDAHPLCSQLPSNGSPTQFMTTWSPEAEAEAAAQLMVVVQNGGAAQLMAAAHIGFALGSPRPIYQTKNAVGASSADADGGIGRSISSAAEVVNALVSSFVDS